MPRDTVALSVALLGQVIVHLHEGERVSGRIVEVEAYPLNDPASHAFRGVRPRCRSMFLPHWHAYVYRIYGTYTCLNISSEVDGDGAAVLIRAIEPLEGISLMQWRRKTDVLRNIARGPGRLNIALDIGMTHDGIDLDSSDEVFLEAGPAPEQIAVGSRIGISSAADAPLRFYDAASPYVSGTKRLNALGVSYRPQACS
jgi:DNA-3-methyladenine glycosylase